MQNAATKAVHPPPPASLPGPDPSRPAFLHRRAPPLAALGKRWHVQQDRRSQILAAARKLMAENGVEQVNLRDIAELCDISIPTIYNTVGDRPRVMQQASSEWVEWLAIDATPLALGAEPLLRILNALWLSAPAWPDYTVNAVRTFSSPNQSLDAAFNGPADSITRKFLQDLRARHLLRPSIAVDRLAWHLNHSVHGGVCNWSLHPYDTTQYRREFADGPGLMLLGALSGTEVPIVERALDAIAAGRPATADPPAPAFRTAAARHRG